MDNYDYDDNIIITKKKINNKKKIIILFGSLIAVICGIVAFFILRHYYKETVTVSFDDYEVYQYFSGLKYNYTGKATIENDEIVSFNDKGEEVTVDDTPIYYQTINNECILPITMGLFSLNERGVNYRVNYFSKLQAELSNKDEMAFISYNKKKKFIDNAFLYDGKDMYVFPYSVKVVVEDVEYELSPLSYIIVNYQNSVEMYNKEKDEYHLVDDIKKDVIANVGNTRINLSTDMILFEEGERLLIKNINKLNLYE